MDNRIVEYLPKYEVLFDYTLNGGITPDISVQHLTREFLVVLDINHKPFVMSLSLIFGLFSKELIK